MKGSWQFFFIVFVLCSYQIRPDHIFRNVSKMVGHNQLGSVGVINGWSSCICQPSYGMHICYTIPPLREWKVRLSEWSSDVKTTTCDGHKCQHQQMDRKAKQGLSNSTAPNIFLHVQVECSQATLRLYTVPSFCRPWVVFITRTKENTAKDKFWP